MRLFFAIDLDELTRAQVVLVAERLRRLDVLSDAVVTWVSPPRLHLTLAFLGEVDPDRALGMRRVAADRWSLTPFRVALGGIGAFPVSGAPRALWLSVTAGEAELARLHAAVWSRLASVPLAPERRGFTAHLTLCRVRRAPPRSGRAIRDALSRVAVASMTWTATDVSLYESRRAADGMSYRLVHRAPLADTGTSGQPAPFASGGSGPRPAKRTMVRRPGEPGSRS